MHLSLSLSLSLSFSCPSFLNASSHLEGIIQIKFLPCPTDCVWSIMVSLSLSWLIEYNFTYHQFSALFIYYKTALAVFKIIIPNVFEWVYMCMCVCVFVYLCVCLFGCVHDWRQFTIYINSLVLFGQFSNYPGSIQNYNSNSTFFNH